MRLTLRRLFPIVGCEADAVAFAEEIVLGERPGGQAGAAAVAGAGSSGAPPLLFSGDGSFSLAPPDLLAETPARIDSCFALPPNPKFPSARIRVRIVQHVRLAGPSTLDHFLSGPIEVHHEFYEGPYNGGTLNLRSCGAGVSHFSEAARVPEAAVAGLLARGDALVISLPLGAWAAVSNGEGGEVVVECGVVTEAGGRLSARRVYRNGRLLEGGACCGSNDRPGTGPWIKYDPSIIDGPGPR